MDSALNLKQAAKALGIGESTLRRHRHHWGIGVVDLGYRTKRILQSEITAFQKRRSEKQAIVI